ncbi:DUF2993 domain-containing protein [Fuchsiella alkaliacetigena]|nr:DUF2993 domain-containing protein [Fuchsiella alkaliacetigena]
MASQLLLPRYFSYRLERALLAEADFESLEVEAKSWPALLMLRGHFQSVDVKGEQLDLAGLQIATLEAELSNLYLDLGQLEQFRELQAEQEFLKMVVTARDLENYLAAKIENIDNLRLRLGPPREAVLRGDFPLLGTHLELKLAGNFELTAENSLVFHPGELMVGEMLVSEELVEQLREEVGFSLDLAKLALPIPLEMEEIRVEKDNLLILSGEERY